MVIWRSPPLLLNGYPVPLVDPTTWRLEMQPCVMADGAEGAEGAEGEGDPEEEIGVTRPLFCHCNAFTCECSDNDNDMSQSLLKEDMT